jgi:hypothetical protein
MMLRPSSLCALRMTLSSCRLSELCYRVTLDPMEAAS